jgi:hypothetical protein
MGTDRALIGLGPFGHSGRRELASGGGKGRGGLGVLTVVGGGQHGDEVRPATSFNGGSYLLSTARGSGRGEIKVGAALDTVEIGRGVGAFYRMGNGGRQVVNE